MDKIFRRYNNRFVLDLIYKYEIGMLMNNLNNHNIGAYNVFNGTIAVNNSMGETVLDFLSWVTEEMIPSMME